jgi:hypothetical protein
MSISVSVSVITSLVVMLGTETIAVTTSWPKWAARNGSTVI